MTQDILPLYIIIVVLFGNMTQVSAATFPVMNIPSVTDNDDLLSAPKLVQQNAAKIKKSNLKSLEKKPFHTDKKVDMAKESYDVRRNFSARESRLDRNSAALARIGENNSDVVKALLETVQDKVPLLDDEKIGQIKWVAKDLNKKATNLNVQIEQAFNKVRADFFIMNVLFPVDDNMAFVGFPQGSAAQRSLYNQAYDMNTTQLLLQSENAEEPQGFVAFILAIPHYLFEIDNLIKLLLIVIFFSGIYKALDFFLNKRW
ncbi:hypothetical protein [methane-oxidizing endosymbiont of Gigantopelta aegis]|uniref:hypothetical protein n=1 Tax=methane-oxidizing endosymbiont of Gigantopelta aegis TaxID=2794938 RepID=UPI0018DB28A8|nr:hypothetical protein [methane-oxidizing endosymbiont of Gigantopelta aegis]